MATKVLDVKKKLTEIAAGLPAVTAAKAHVTHGHPAGEPERRSVMVLKAEWEKSAWATNRSREEQFGVNVRFLAFVMAGSAVDAEQAVIDLASEFEDAIKANPSLGITGVLRTDCIPREFDSAPADGGWIAGLDYEVRVTARI